MTQTDISHDALPEAARDTALMFLDVQRKKDAEHRDQGDRLARAAATFIHLARERGVPWTDIAHALGVSVWAARRIARRRQH